MKFTMKPVVLAVALTTASLTVNAGDSWKDSAKDAWIDGKAETTLLFNEHLSSFDINTDVKDGVVMLTGKVEREVDKALATELIMSLDGVTDVNNELTVVNQNEEDSEIMDDLKDSKVETVVKTRLLFESEVSGLDIEVEANKGTVTLTGKVDSEAERDLAIAIAKRTNDVKNVIDKLQIVS
ncbi:BON domain-containing protein [Paraglaciecola hydrolytica]|uniref:Transporter n=1 Tax=Paraglaciecola hydrolytica TaxID=1799789 RepID=A0A135ZYL7_9ALTE|nr:BON domain-containing protein [Paraglaciecola hydrolytica]KXI28078.1 transporter [Paraglaciecola hydrolytica]